MICDKISEEAIKEEAWQEEADQAIWEEIDHSSITITLTTLEIEVVWAIKMIISEEAVALKEEIKEEISKIITILEIKEEEALVDLEEVQMMVIINLYIYF